MAPRKSFNYASHSRDTTNPNTGSMITTTAGMIPFRWMTLGRPNTGPCDNCYSLLALWRRVNACNARARGRKRPAEPQLEFRTKLAKLMLQNTLGENTEPAGMSLRGRASLNGVIHQLVKRQKYEGAWDNTTQSFAKTKQKYQKSNCGIVDLAVVALDSRFLVLERAV
ncbi:hypothetical protein ACHAWO_007978 [Cyclotella atomus]|uniref:Uncharacterized protein n=1 Tax=Cyclotella atomus TaxID=382360 RepID=A0ABD3PGL1_9STRA